MRPDDEVLERLEEQVAAAHTALLLVDVQNDFLHPDGVLCRKVMGNYQDDSLVPGMVAATRRLLAAAREADVFTVFIQNLGDLVYQSGPALALQRRQGGGTPVMAVQEGTWGCDFLDDIRPDGREREAVVRKHRYSAFVGTNLDMVLRSNGIKTLVMCGDATSGCVESTTRDGFFHDYYVVTAGDACADFDLGRHEASLRKVDQAFGYVVPTDAISAVWAEGSDAASTTSGAAVTR